jgi:hypothetical protein
MCFSFEISIATFVISWGISLYLINNKKMNIKQENDIYFLMIFSSMQLADAILWFIKMKKNNINYIVSSVFVPLILSFQILFNLFYRNKGKYIPLNILGIFTIFYLFYKFNGYSSSVCNNSLSSPIWASNEIKLWEVIIFSILIFYPNINNLFILSTFFIFFTLLYIFMDGAYGSLWCAIANIVAFKYLLTY